jgi:hypothetical protein
MSRRDITLRDEDDVETFDDVQQHLSRHRHGTISNPEVVRRLLEYYVETEGMRLSTA